MDKEKAWNVIRIEDWLHKKCGKLLIVGEAPTRETAAGKRNTYFLCECECGKICEARRSRVKSGRITSCGCNKGAGGGQKPIHGMTGTLTHSSFIAMLRRCTNPNSSDAARYYDRGIKVCDRWLEPKGKGFMNFLEDVGERPSKLHSLDRINNEGNYEPVNVAWKTMKEQSRNRRSNTFYTYRGEEKCIAEWEELFGFSKNMIHGRLKRGYSFQQAMDMGPKDVRVIKAVVVENTETGEIEVFEKQKLATDKYPGIIPNLKSGKLYRKIFKAYYKTL